MTQRLTAWFAIALLLGALAGCASSSGSTTSRRSRTVYHGGGVHYNSFPDAYEYRGRMGMPY